MQKRPDLVTSDHLARDAAVYGRQSSGIQVEQNTGSTEYQRAQAEWPVRWGWRPNQVRRFEDFGLSGTAALHRLEYMRLREEIRARKIGALFVSDITRLGRDSKELLDLIRECVAFNVLIVIDGKILDLKDTNQWLTTSLLAILAEFDGLSRRDTLHRGRLAKLKAGRAVSAPPAGYVSQPDKSWIKHPDPAVRDSVRAVFREFLKHRSLRRTVIALRALDLKIPRQKPGWPMRMEEPVVHMLQDMLRHPAYRGHYAYRRKVDDHTKSRSAKGRYRPRIARGDEMVIITNHHEPYITEVEANEIDTILSSNGWSRKHGSVGHGQAVVQGLPRCGDHPTRIMRVHYKKGSDGRSYRYCCRGNYEIGGRSCITLSGRLLDRAVAGAMLERLSVPSLTALKEALDVAIADSCATRRQWQMELDRLRHEANELECKIAMLDAGNRGVFKRLEQRLESTSRHIERLESLIADDGGALRRDEAMLVDLIELAKDLRSVWDATTTTHRDRKELVRMMVREVVVESVARRQVVVTIEWIGGAPATCVTLWLPAAVQQYIRERADEGAANEAIAAELSTRGVRTIKGNEWTPAGVGHAIWQMRRKAGVLAGAH